MQPWGGSVLENEAAARWCEEFVADGSVVAICDALKVAAGRPDDVCLDATEAAHALAAAEIVAAAAGRVESPEALPSGVLSWAAHHPDAGDADVRSLARSAIQRTINGRSGLAEEWTAAQERRGWQVTVESLFGRLS